MFRDIKPSTRPGRALVTAVGGAPRLEVRRRLTAECPVLIPLTGGHSLERWNSDPNLRLRYLRAGRRQVIHPDGLVRVRSSIGDHWLFVEIDRGPYESRRNGPKLRRNAHFYLPATCGGSTRRLSRRGVEIPIRR